MIGRATLFSHPGGDTVQIIKTAEYLNKTNSVRVDVKTVSEEVNYKDFDLLHLFNISRPSDSLGIIKKAKLPYVLSTIFVDFSEAEANHFSFSRRILKKIFGIDNIEYLKTLGRISKRQDKLTDYKYFFLGQKKSITKILKNAKLLLPNSNNEYHRLLKCYGIKQKYKVIPNAIDIEIFSDKKGTDKKYEIFTDSIICVGQITPIKNQLNLIKALNNTNYKVFIIGSPSSNAKRYFRKCQKIAADNINFIPYVKQDELSKIYSKAKVHVLTSWFETTGLVSLEAAYSGCNIVITNKGDQYEYFNDHAFYCDPNCPLSILEAVNKAFKAKFNHMLKRKIESNFTWEMTAKKTHEAYLASTQL